MHGCNPVAQGPCGTPHTAGALLQLTQHCERKRGIGERAVERGPVEACVRRLTGERGIEGGRRGRIESRRQQG
ncbi:MAG: hypothetical protein EBT54_03710 [Betaproteobacteria bacterium]|nr:hypothetical protein [Betaproteobacteria bacterium]